jgi:hypothetical protein
MLQKTANAEVHKKIIGKTEYIITSMYNGKENINRKIINLIVRKSEAEK